jgi:shikimate kinase
LAYELKKSVVLVGMMGAGKTAVGTALARRIDVEFFDTDTELVRAANMSIPEIFHRDGEEFFRQREGEVLVRLLNSQPCILATGGGAFLLETNRAAIARQGVSLWLKADLELLWSRVRHKNTRPLLQVANPREKLHELCITREKSYCLADMVVCSRADYSIEDMTDAVMQTLLAYDEILEWQ